MTIEQDAARWRWFREHWSQLVFETEMGFTSDRKVCVRITTNDKFYRGNGESLDRAIDIARGETT